jgi:hypothetical protein
MKKSCLSFVIVGLMAVFLTFGVAKESHAVLAAVGPVDPGNGFPQWYQDTLGVQLMPCLTNVPACGLLAAVGFDPAQPIVFPGNFPDELFYWSAGTDFLALGPAGAGGSVLVLALEGAFANAVVAGDQMTFSRVQVGPTDGLVPGATYTFDHPFGTFTGVADAAGVVARFRDEFGCAPVPPVVLCDFSIALGAGPVGLQTVGPFLKQLAPAPPAGFIGDGGATGVATMEPGPNGDAFTITGQDVGGVGVNTVTVNNAWAITGQIFAILTRFNDVPVGHPFLTQINAIADAGITGGCSAVPPLFCPDAPITRAQMAVFMETSLGVAAPPACTGTRFTDVTPALLGQPLCNFIEDFANRGITGGCTATQFCPNDPVTRGQMAVFIETAMGTPVAACQGIQFADVPATHPFCSFIEELSRDGVTGGCTATTFCPNDPVTRGQMAVFLVAAPPPLTP